MNTLNIIVLVAAVVCTYLGQSKAATRTDKRNFSLLGGLACAGVAFDAITRGDNSSAAIFMFACLMNIAVIIANYWKPAND